jgi:hypothetical protein
LKKNHRFQFFKYSRIKKLLVPILSKNSESKNRWFQIFQKPLKKPTIFMKKLMVLYWFFDFFILLRITFIFQNQFFDLFLELPSKWVHVQVLSSYILISGYESGYSLNMHISISLVLLSATIWIRQLTPQVLTNLYGYLNVVIYDINIHIWTLVVFHFLDMDSCIMHIEYKRLYMTDLKALKIESIC